MTTTTHQVAIGQIIRALRTEYVQTHAFTASYYEINNGLCDEFAEEVVKRLSPSFSRPYEVLTVGGENFMVGGYGGEWDGPLLASAWGMRPPEHFTWEALDEVPFGSHVWVTDETLHYDAECPEGVANFFDLPLFRRYIVSNLRRRGLDCPDVTTEDVVPAPQCPISAKDYVSNSVPA